MLEGPILAKDLAIEYKYLANTSEWFYIARKNAERVIRNMTSLTKGKKSIFFLQDWQRFSLFILNFIILLGRTAYATLFRLL